MLPIDRDNPNRLLAIGLSMALAASGKTRQDIAAAAGISGTHVTKLATGQSSPSQTVLVDFARAVDCSISEIYKLGEDALERERQRSSRADQRQAVSNRSAEALIEAAAWLDDDGLIQVMEALQRLRAKTDTP